MVYKPNHPLFLLAYQFNAETLRYVNVTLAHLNPAESTDTESKFFIEENATFDPVPHLAPYGKDWYRKGGKEGEWLLVDDTDLLTWYDTTTGVPTAKPVFGEPVPSTMTSIAPNPADGEVVMGFDTKAKAWKYRKNMANTEVYSTTDQSIKILTAEDTVVPEGYTTVKPTSTYEDWHSKTNKWIINIEKKAEADAAQAVKDAGQKVAAMTQFVQNYLDTTAQGFGFDDIKSAALRASFTGSPLQPIGLSLGVWMDNVWMTCKELLAQWQNGEIAEPTIETLQDALPPAPTN